MQTSAKGIGLLESFEGLELGAYPDPKSPLGRACTALNMLGHSYRKVAGWQTLSGAPWTIGFGDTGPSVVAGVTITRDEAIARLKTRLATEFEPAVNRIQVPMSQNEFDALVSLCYNIGVNGFHSSQAYAKMCIGDRTGASEGFMHWTDHGLLAGRRQKEREVFDDAAY